MIKYNCRFVLPNSHPDKNGLCRLRMRVTLKGAGTLEYFTPYSAKPTDFSFEYQRVGGAAPQAAEINRCIYDWRAIVADTFARFDVVEKRIPTAEELNEVLLAAINPPTKGRARALANNYGFFISFQRFMSLESVERNWSDNTIKGMRNFIDNVREFDNTLTFDAIDNVCLSNYVHFMLNVKGYKNTTIHKNIVKMRWYLRWAAANDLYHGNAHETFTPKFKGMTGRSKDIVYLTADEVRRMETWQFADHQIEMEFVRDVFIFCCFTGLRFSDVEKLTKDDIKEGGNCIDVVMQKTSVAVRIELNDHAKAILQKYAAFEMLGNRALPVTYNQKANDLLKQIGQLCGIDEPFRAVHFRGNKRVEEVVPKWQMLTTHVGRKTFVVQGLRLGIPAEVIMKWTGHSNYDAIRPYVDIVDELKKNEMSKFNAF